MPSPRAGRRPRLAWPSSPALAASASGQPAGSGHRTRSQWPLQLSGPAGGRGPVAPPPRASASSCEVEHCHRSCQSARRGRRPQGRRRPPPRARWPEPALALLSGDAAHSHVPVQGQAGGLHAACRGDRPASKGAARPAHAGQPEGHGGVSGLLEFWTSCGRLSLFSRVVAPSVHEERAHTPLQRGGQAKTDSGP